MWFTADTHFGHSNIIELTHRPFSSVQEMDRRLIANINDRVSARDSLYILGDFSFRMTVEEAYAIRKKIVCQHVHLIRGNHDKHWIDSPFPDAFESEQDYLEIKPGSAWTCSITPC